MLLGLKRYFSNFGKRDVLQKFLLDFFFHVNKRKQKADTLFVITAASKLKTKPECIWILMNKIFICADSHCYIPYISQWTLPYMDRDVKYKYKDKQSVHSSKFDWLLNTEIIRHHHEGTAPILKSQDVFLLLIVSFIAV